MHTVSHRLPMMVLLFSSVLAGCGGMEDALTEGVATDGTGEAFYRHLSGPPPLLLQDSIRVGDPIDSGDPIDPGGGGLKAPLQENPVTQALLVDSDGQFNYSGFPFGVSYNVVEGYSRCAGGRKFYSGTARRISGTGWCSYAGKLNADPYDCRILVHVGATAFEAGTCYWVVYSQW